LTALENQIERPPVWYLKECAFLSSLSEEEIHQVFSRSEIVSLPEKEVIPLGYENSGSIWIVKRGYVTLNVTDQDGNESTTMILGPCDSFGSLNHSENESVDQLYSEIPRTLTSCCLCRVSEQAFRSMLKKYPIVSSDFTRAQFKRAHEIQIRIAEILHKSVTQRLSIILLELIRIAGVELSDGSTKIDLKISHREIAQMIGTSREVVTRFLIDFQKQGLIKTEPRMVTVLTVEELKKLC